MSKIKDVALRMACGWLAFLGAVGLVLERYWYPGETLFWICAAQIAGCAVVIFCSAPAGETGR